MKATARWLLMILTALFVVPGAWATVQVQVVDIDGTQYTVREDGQGGSSSESTALAYTVASPSGTTVEGVVAPTGDPLVDRDPRLALLPGGGGPVLIWTRNDGLYDQIAYSRYQGNDWSDFTFMTTGARHHNRPDMGIDGSGMGLVLWTERQGSGAVMYSTFDPGTGILTMAPRNLLLEMVRTGPPQWLTHERPDRPAQGRPHISGPAQEGGNDAPAVPPANSPAGDALATASCSKAAVAVIRNRSLAIGLVENGWVVKYFRSVVPPGASQDYVDLFLMSLLQQNCP